MKMLLFMGLVCMSSFSMDKIQRVDAQTNIAKPRPEFMEEFKADKVRHVYTSNPSIEIEVAQGIRHITVSANESADSNDSIPRKHHHRRMLLSNGATAVVTALITAGVTLTVHFTSCKK